ncbi:hypothetical protein DXG03_001935 [Asterophora parasitica]|uniref:MI domain-containing protein n=1 Tax=Asterophora parasitica TaxID=117018 RepID=A0A9P7K6B2_9AGAR|nr:hypothetical protein DXG03_001935 [Asterophora parasitica]
MDVESIRLDPELAHETMVLLKCQLESTKKVIKELRAELAAAKEAVVVQPPEACATFFLKCLFDSTCTPNQDDLELREYATRSAVTTPSTIAEIHKATTKEKAAADEKSRQHDIYMSRGGWRHRAATAMKHEAMDQAVEEKAAVKDSYQHQVRVMSPGGSRGGGVRSGSNDPSRPPSRPPATYDPSSVFSGKTDVERESLSSTGSGLNVFAMLSQNAGPAEEAKAPESRQKQLVFMPRTKTTDDAAPVEMTKQQTTKKIIEDVKEFFAVRNLDEAEVYFFALPVAYHSKLVDQLTMRAVESKEADVQLLASLFAHVVEKELCSVAAFDEGLASIAEIIDDIAIDVPRALSYFAVVVKSVSLDDDRRTRLASKALDSEELLALLS